MKVKFDVADRLFALWIKYRDSWTCQRCGKQYAPRSQGLDCSHFKSRKSENLRFEPLNADAICTGCHFFFSTHPNEHRDWQIATKGQEVVDKLEIAFRTYKKKDRVAEKLYWRQKLLQDFNIKA